MELLQQESGPAQRICVLGQVEDQKDRLHLAQKIGNVPAGTGLQLDFFDADKLDADTIGFLDDCAGKHPSFKIFIYHYLLGQRLLRLGLPVHQVIPQSPACKPLQCRCLAIAGSANSLDKLLYIIERLPRSDAVIFVVQHLLEAQISCLDQLLRMKTAYQVLMPQHMTALAPGTVYVAPPGHHMKVAHGYVYLTRDQKIQFARPSFDALLFSLAEEYKSECTAVILCGFGQDGVAGCEALMHQKAVVIVEDPVDCAEAVDLPEAVCRTGHFDYQLRYQAIASLLAEGIAVEYALNCPENLDYFLEALLAVYGHDFRQYQKESLKRRIDNLKIRLSLKRLMDIQLAVFSMPAMFDKMLAEISVPVTQFFRHPEQFLFLRRHCLPYLDSFPVVRIWSAGCATGEEAYSLAILCTELGMLKKCRIFATDINPYLLDQARNGLFPLEAEQTGQGNYLLSGGDGKFSDYFKLRPHYAEVRPDIKTQPAFHQHSLVHSASFNEFQLIICRNVLIYFDADLQAAILRRFFQALHDDGYLILEPQGLDMVARASGFTQVAGVAGVYRKRFER